MSTNTQILYHIVFSTKNRVPALNEQNQAILFKDIWGILNNKKCHLYRINGVEDHIHIITHLHPSIALSSLIKSIKLGSSHFIKKYQLFPNFTGWQSGYGAFTYSINEKENLIQYVKNQKDHHRRCTYKEELIMLLNEHSINFDERYLL
ncbi:IS200/IS605 family transposase [Membranihabitans maritimus]|uniref:IS200/IS605 family transposase n=1 Tax=Membranihabitans maritimus TaxID=2904244 RepID=UPI001F01614E|nr:IS200/IS605 family transposase [Membranihabitans maritimus]